MGRGLGYKHQRSICNICEVYVHGKGARRAPDLGLLGGSEAFSTATHRTLTKALDGRTLYKVVCDVKPDCADLRVFSVLCAIISTSE